MMISAETAGNKDHAGTKDRVRSCWTQRQHFEMAVLARME
jgi:hypothetical protein